ncbi:MAG: hypothetical protein ACRENP_25080 [Longimicrobiales bacterium]
MTETDRQLIWNHIQRVHGDQHVLTVDELNGSLRKERQAFERSDLILLLKQFGKDGLGRFLTGRRGKRSRMNWNRKPRELTATKVSFMAPNPSRAGSGVVTMLESSVPLRPGVIAKVFLPADLSSAEANRVAQVVQQLSLD